MADDDSDNGNEGSSYDDDFLSRDYNGQLIRDREATRSDYKNLSRVGIDGVEVAIPIAVPSTDAQGNILLDESGQTIPRFSTFYDAAYVYCEQTYQKDSAGNKGVTGGYRSAKEKLDSIIPTVCHLEHLRPAGVCRICCVELNEKLVAACAQRLPEDNDASNKKVHQIKTLATSEMVRESTKVLLELLAAEAPEASGGHCDLSRVIEKVNPWLKGLGEVRWGNENRISSLQLPSAKPTKTDDSSKLILVNHEACILCDRCARACTDVKQNFVIGRSGKGYESGIGFDLNADMGKSSCVECGECMLSCPTNALTLKPRTECSEWFKEKLEFRSPQVAFSKVTPPEMQENDLLRLLPWRVREWNQDAIVKATVVQEFELCREGDYGATAYLLQAGKFRIERSGKKTLELGPKALILGEMACFSFQTRTAKVTALPGAVYFEIRRNMLFALQRVKEPREQLFKIYRNRALRNLIDAASVFGELTTADSETAKNHLLKGCETPRDRRDAERNAAGTGAMHVEFLELQPGQLVYEEGDRADGVYLIRIGHVAVSKAGQGVLTYLRPLTDSSASRAKGASPPAGRNMPYFGEIACLAGWSDPAVKQSRILSDLSDDRRTATCRALDDVEVIRISKEWFLELLAKVPALKAVVIKHAETLLDRDARHAAPAPSRSSAGPGLRAVVEQGLYNAQRLLVLDLEACTRCDECTKACSDTHDGVTRLIRDGLRVDKWLVASSCRSCTDPYCLVGCPVDAIHREGRNSQIVIESHCIGCGVCESNCPYGNINMHPDPKKKGQNVATTCDLCTGEEIPGRAKVYRSDNQAGDEWRKVNCVYSCPHNAAFRMTGDELVEKVTGFRPA